MKFKVFSKTELLAVTLATALFMTACSSAKTTEQTTEDTVITEAVTTTEATAEETTAATEAATEATTETQAEDAISPLDYGGIDMVQTMFESGVLEKSQLFDFVTYCGFFNPVEAADKQSDYDWSLRSWQSGPSYKISSVPGEENKTYDAEFYLTGDNNYEESGDIWDDAAHAPDTYSLVIYYEIDGKSGALTTFAPFYYNQAKGCFAGFETNSDMSDISWVEVYYSPSMGELVSVPADAAEYGF